jgi:hypothetical protein
MSGLTRTAAERRCPPNSLFLRIKFRAGAEIRENYQFLTRGPAKRRFFHHPTAVDAKSDGRFAPPTCLGVPKKSRLPLPT